MTVGLQRLDDGATLNFYVDGILGRTITSAADVTIDSLTIGSVGAGTTARNASIDGIALVWRRTRRAE